MCKTFPTSIQAFIICYHAL
uniref:Uncharacterized protein n=1 Tax=Arundo donax TaxID=35708 RepID=A0A0A9BD29_ARUDO